MKCFRNCCHQTMPLTYHAPFLCQQLFVCVILMRIWVWIAREVRMKQRQRTGCFVTPNMLPSKPSRVSVSGKKALACLVATTFTWAQAPSFLTSSGSFMAATLPKTFILQLSELSCCILMQQSIPAPRQVGKVLSRHASVVVTAWP